MQDSPYLQEQLDCWVSPVIWAMGKNPCKGRTEPGQRSQNQHHPASWAVNPPVQQVFFQQKWGREAPAWP